MRRNIATTLRRRDDPRPMDSYDRLPGELRAWLAQAALPWSPASALRLWQKGLREAGGDTARARARLDRAEAGLLRRDGARIWGASHPAAAGPDHLPAGGPSR